MSLVNIKKFLVGTSRGDRKERFSFQQSLMKETTIELWNVDDVKCLEAVELHLSIGIKGTSHE